MRNDILNIKNCKRIAVMGGTFDPIHYGHLVAAETVRQELDIDKVIFIPTGRPPHKINSRLASDEHRYLMTVLAVVTNPHFDVSRTEIDRPGTTYTIDTIRELRKKCSDDTELFFITGADAINQILTWKDPEVLLKLCHFVAVTRPDSSKEKFTENVKYYKEKFGADITMLEIPALAISSTDIRKRVFENKTIKYLLPESVEQYIINNSLYTDDTGKKTYNTDLINKKLRHALTEQRYLHTQGVAEMAVRLAGIYNEDKDKARVAALLHDCAKCIENDESLRLCREYGVPLDEVLLAQPDLCHSFLGEKVAENDYDISDKDILSAIKYHTTGHAAMTMLEKIIFIADYIEFGRKNFDGLEETRNTAYEDIDKAVYMCLKQTIDFNRKKGRLIHFLSLEALNYYSNIIEKGDKT